MESSKIILSRHQAVKVWYARPATLLALLLGLVAMVGWASTSAANYRGGSYHHRKRIVRMRGRSRGGYQPVSGSAVTLYEVGTTGYGSAPTILATTTTDERGNWNIATFTCAPANAELYLTSVGGNAGPGNNSAIDLMAAIGPCDNLPEFVNINEVSTVASVYALTAFVARVIPHDIGMPTSNSQGLVNAITAVKNLVHLGTGIALATTPAGNGTAPQDKVNTLADLLVTCVDSSGPVSIACSNLFAAAAPPGGSTPGDTLSAILDIALNPANNVSELFTLVPPNYPFKPTLTAAPTDWTLALNYAGGGLNGPLGVATDTSGNVWVANNASDSVTKLSSAGAALSPAGGFTGGGLSNPLDLAIDGSGNVWIANPGHSINSGQGSGISSVTELDSNGSPLSGGSGFATGNLIAAIGVVIDLNGLVWVSDNKSNSLLEMCGSNPGNCPTNYNTGDVISNPAYTGGGLNNPALIAIDALNLIWVANNGFGGGIGTSLSEFCGSTTASCPAGVQTGDPISSSSGYGGGGLLAPLFVAVDPSGNIWLANTGNSTISEFCGAVTANCPSQTPPLNTGDPISPATGYAGGGLNTPIGLATDSLGNVWVANNANDSMSEINPGGLPLSPATGFTGGGLNGPGGIALDASGDIWLTNNNGNSVTEFLGLAAPIKLPLIGPPQSFL
jgi:streptogramin lyase